MMPLLLPRQAQSEEERQNDDAKKQKALSKRCKRYEPVFISVGASNIVEVHAASRL